MAFIWNRRQRGKADQKPKDEEDTSDDQFNPLSFIRRRRRRDKPTQEPTEPEPKNEETSDDQFNPLSFILGLDEK